MTLSLRYWQQVIVELHQHTQCYESEVQENPPKVVFLIHLPSLGRHPRQQRAGLGTSNNTDQRTSKEKENKAKSTSELRDSI